MLLPHTSKPHTDTNCVAQGGLEGVKQQLGVSGSPLLEPQLVITSSMSSVDSFRGQRSYGGSPVVEQQRHHGTASVPASTMVHGTSRYGGSPVVEQQRHQQRATVGSPTPLGAMGTPPHYMQPSNNQQLSGAVLAGYLSAGTPQPINGSPGLQPVRPSERLPGGGPGAVNAVGTRRFLRRTDSSFPGVLMPSGEKWLCSS